MAPRTPDLGNPDEFRLPDGLIQSPDKFEKILGGLVKSGRFRPPNRPDPSDKSGQILENRIMHLGELSGVLYFRGHSLKSSNIIPGR